MDKTYTFFHIIPIGHRNMTGKYRLYMGYK